MDNLHKEIWDGMFSSSSMKASNLGWSDKYNTIGCITGPNVYYHAPTMDILRNCRCLFWHPISLSHMIASKSIAVDCIEGGFVRPKDVDMLFSGRFPLIVNWDCLEPYYNPKIMTNLPFLHELIIRQDKALDKVTASKKEYKNKYYELKNVCLNYYLLYKILP